MSKSVEWVNSDQRLAELCEQWLQQPVIALDTEFIRTRTFFPKIGLLQVADLEGIYLVDPLAITAIEPLQRVMSQASVVKVIHSCSEDLEVFDRFLSVLPDPLFDTQLAAAFTGKGASISYANLVKHIRGDEIPKQETRSDWLQRPLSQSQLDYAALDVEHLLEVYETLQSELALNQRTPWFEKECQQAIEKVSYSNRFDQYYLRIKSAWKLKPKQLAVLRDLCVWREKQAREVDIPRSHLIKDTSLFELARTLPKETNQFYKLRDMHPRFVSRYGEQCLIVLQSALSDASRYPESMLAPLTAEQTTLYKQLKATVASIAEGLSIPPEFLARKKDLETLVHRAKDDVITLPNSLQGWREEVIGKPLLANLSEIIL